MLDGDDQVADFVTVVVDEGTEVVFQSAECDLVKPHGGRPRIAGLSRRSPQ